MLISSSGHNGGIPHIAMAWAAAIAPLAGAVAVERRGRTDRTEKDASLALFDSARAKLAVQTIPGLQSQLVCPGMSCLQSPALYVGAG